MAHIHLINIAPSLGLIASAAFFTMNTTLNYIAFPSYFVSKRSAFNNPETSNLLLLQWRETYQRGHTVGPPLAIFQSAAYMLTAYQSGLETVSGRCYMASAICAVAVVPYTLLIMLETNKFLLEETDVAERIIGNDSDDQRELLVGGKLKIRASEALQKWIAMSKTRAVMPLGSIAFALAAIWQR
jgi:hypothetical protein